MTSPSQARASGGLLDGDADDADVVMRLVGLGVGLDDTDVLNDFHALHNAGKHCVLVVQPWLYTDKYTCCQHPQSATHCTL